MRTKTRIVIADDHPIFRQGLRQIIERDPTLTVVGEAEDGAAALSLIQTERPDLAILDVDMPTLDGFRVARALAASRLDVPLIFLTMHMDEGLFNEALDLNARGYVLKDTAISDLLQCVRAVLAGGNFISAQLTSLLLKRRNAGAGLLRQNPGLGDLTPTERRVLMLIADDKTNREIAEEMFISVRTVESHRANISQKLDLRGAHALLKFALAHKSELS
jgi:DNA-binding NarL/FixJ family response regulator